jgi:hypothetical protein
MDNTIVDLAGPEIGGQGEQTGRDRAFKHNHWKNLPATEA